MLIYGVETYIMQTRKVHKVGMDVTPMTSTSGNIVPSNLQLQIRMLLPCGLFLQIAGAIGLLTSSRRSGACVRFRVEQQGATARCLMAMCTLSLGAGAAAGCRHRTYIYIYYICIYCRCLWQCVFLKPGCCCCCRALPASIFVRI